MSIVCVIAESCSPMRNGRVKRHSFCVIRALGNTIGIEPRRGPLCNDASVYGGARPVLSAQRGSWSSRRSRIRRADGDGHGFALAADEGAVLVGDLALKLLGHERSLRWSPQRRRIRAFTVSSPLPAPFRMLARSCVCVKLRAPPVVPCEVRR